MWRGEGNDLLRLEGGEGGEGQLSKCLTGSRVKTEDIVNTEIL